MGRLVRHSKGMGDDGGSLLCVRFFCLRVLCDLLLRVSSWEMHP
jgi:hypothetical protein